jgi:hypothetical protein
MFLGAHKKSIHRMHTLGDIQDQSSKSTVGRSPERKKYNREVNNDPLDKLKMPQNRLGLPKSLILLVPPVDTQPQSTL